MPKLPIEYLVPSTPFHYNGAADSATVLDFWSWAFSDCFNNTTRGVLAEFIVAYALDLDLRQPRDAWAKFDLTYKGRSLEVKSASYHQRWHQDALSRISFSVRPTRAWDANTNKLEENAKRQADAYVLCLLAEKRRDKVDPLDLAQWRFWVVPTQFLNERSRSQYSITENSLIAEIGNPVNFTKLRDKLGTVLDNAV